MAKIDLEQAGIWVVGALGLHAHELTKALANRYQVSSSTAAVTIRQLEQQGLIRRTGPVNRPVFEASSDVTLMQSYRFPLDDVAQLWERDFATGLSGQLTAGQRSALRTAFIALAENAQRHSKGNCLHVVIEQTQTHLEMMLQDNGMGLFKHVCQSLACADLAAAALVIAGPENKKIFTGINPLIPTFDYFLIEANGMHYPAAAAPEEHEIDEELFEQGTTVILELTLS